ncbi:hypothetical protein ACFCT7_16085 [Fulvivirgaceae bacterium LMO-SS25]
MFNLLSCLVVGILLLNFPAYSSASDFPQSQSIVSGFSLEINGDNISSIEIDNDKSNIPNSPQKDSPFSDNGENEEENREKDNDEDDISSHDFNQNLRVDLFRLSTNFISTPIFYGLKSIPLYLLFHCWKNFLS